MGLFARAVNKYRKILYFKFYRKKRVANYKEKLTNSNFSIICSNCFGGMLYHDLDLKFLSPTINLYMKAYDYIDFLENLEHYLNCDIADGGDSEEGGVIGILDNKIKLYGIHYNTFSELETKWKERCQRVNFDNLYVIGFYRDGCTDEIVKRFCALPYKHKVFLSHKKIVCADNNCIVQMKCHRGAKEIPGADKMSSIKSRAYDSSFDFIEWLNQK